MVGPLNVAKVDKCKAKIGVKNTKSLNLKPITPLECHNFINGEPGLVHKQKNAKRCTL